MHAFSSFRSSTSRPLTLKLVFSLAVICCAFAGLRASGQTVRFLGEDRTTKGSWRGVYGKEGYNIGKHDAIAPSYGAVITPPDPYSPPEEDPPNPPPYYNDTWNAGGDVRGLQRASGTDRVAPVWTTPNSFDVDFTFHDNNKHIISIYCVDWDSNVRSQTIQILNPSTGAVLDTRSLSGFNGGVYVKWEIAGSVKVRMTKVAGSAVFSGIFFDGISNARFVGEDRVTQGNWKGKYGKEGYYIGNTAANVKVPTYGQLAVTGNSYASWSTGTDVRGLQAPTSTGRIAPYWSTTNATTPFEMTFNSNSNDLPHLLSFYCLDWGTVVRSQKIEIFDFVTNDLLASCNLADYEIGTYAKFEVTGGVRVKVTNLAGSVSAVVSAVFFDQVAAAGFVGEDRHTKGDWKGTYGKEAHYIGTLPNKIPAYGSLAMTGTSYSTWMPGTDLRGLQHPDFASTERVAPHWFTGSSFEIDFDASEARDFHLLSIYCLDWDGNGRSQKIEIFNRVTGDLLTSCDLSNFQAGTYARFHVKGGVRVKVSNGAGSLNAVVSAVFFDPINPVRFVGEDRAIQGNWKGVYGKGGCYIGTDSSNAPSYGSAVLTGASNSAWTVGEDVRGLQEATGTGRVAPHWWSSTSYDIDFAFADAKKHVISLYCLDWDNQGRSQKIEVMNPETGLIFDTRTISQFQNGVYLRWEITGKVRVKVTSLNQTAVISGIFFDETSGAARFVNEDRITKGDWKGAYGSDGYCIPDHPYTMPSYGSSFTISPGVSNSASASGDDLRGLQSPVGEGRIAPRWQAGTSFDLTFCATDNVTPHLLSVYCVNWENISRSQKIEVFDLVTNDLLDSRGVSSFTNGAYLRWEVKGGVRLRVSNTGGADAVLSGVFFDPIVGSRTAHNNFQEVPYFRSEPLPPEYQGKSVKELGAISINETSLPASPALADYKWSPTKRIWTSQSVANAQQSAVMPVADFINGTLRVINRGAAGFSLQMQISNNGTSWSNHLTLSVDANSSQTMLIGEPDATSFRLVTTSASADVSVSILRGYASSASEFKPHTDLNNFVADMDSDPMALAAFVQNEIALVDAVRKEDRLADLSGLQSAPIPPAKMSIVPAEMRRNAYTTYLQRRGSPYEQCNLLVYLLREAGYAAALVDPVGTEVKMLSKRLSNMLHLQMKGFVTDDEDQLVEVDYPWVVFYDADSSQWRPLFPWIKDTVVEEGFDLYDFMPEKYDTGAKWLDAYLKNDPAVNEFVGGDGSDIPSMMFKKFVEKQIAQKGLSIKDVGFRIYDRNTVFSRWEDFPVPFSVKPNNPSAALTLKKDWTGSPALYSYVRVALLDSADREVLTTNRTGISVPSDVPSSWQRAMDLNGRSIFMRTDPAQYDRANAGGGAYYQMNMWMVIGPFDPIYETVNTIAPHVFLADTGFPDAAIHGGILKYRRLLEHFYWGGVDYESLYPAGGSFVDARNVEQNYRGNSLSARIEWRGSSSTGAPIVDVSKRGIGRTDVAGVNLSFGSVTLADLEKLRLEANKATDRWDRLGTVTHLAGQGYFERVDRFGKELQLLHKCQSDVVGFGVTVLKTDEEKVLAPRIDMPMHSLPYWNSSLRPDQRAARYDVIRDFSNVLAAELSAQEHAVINDFYHQKDAISTVKLLRIANRTREIARSHETLLPGVGGDSALEFPDGFYEMSAEDFQKRYTEAEAATTPTPPATSLPTNTPAKVISDLKGVFTRYSKTSNQDLSGTAPNKVPLANRPAFGTKWAGGPSNEDFLAVYTSQSTVDANNIYSNFTTGSSWAELKKWCDENPGGKLYVTPGPVKSEDSLSQPSYVGWGSLMVGATGNLAGWIEGNQAAYYNGGFGVNFNDNYSKAFNSTNFANLSISSFGNDFFLTGSGINSINLINPTWEAVNSWSTPYSLSPVTPFSSAYSHGFGNMASGWAGVMNDGYFGDSQFHRGWETSPNFVEDPVNVVNGEFYMDEVDLTLPGPLSMELRRNYSSQSEANSLLGPGWKLSLMPFLSVSGKNPGDEGYDAVEHANKPKGFLIYAADLDGSVLAFRDQSAASKVTANATWSANSTFINVNNVAGIVVGQTAGAGGIPAHARVTAINTTTKRVTLSAPTTIAKSTAVPVIFGGMGPWKVDAADNPGLKNFNGKEYEETRNPFNDRIEKSDDTYTWYKADGSKLIYAIRAFPIKVEQEAANTFKEYDRRMPYLTHFHDPVGNSFEFSFYAQSNAAAGVAVELQNAEVGYGQLKRIRSSNGNFMLFNYDSQQRVQEVATNDGRRVKYRYDPLGDLVEAELPDGAVSSYEYQRELAPRPDSQAEGFNNGNDWYVALPAAASGSRVKGWLQPQTTGAYKFRLTGNSGEVKLLVSSGDSEDPASLTTALTARSVASATFNLIAGKSYYIETRHTGGSGAYLKLEWQKPGETSTTWNTITKGNLLKPEKPNPSAEDPITRRIVGEIYKNISPATMVGMEDLVQFKGVPYSRNLMTKFTDAEGRVTLNEYDTAFRPDHPVFGDYKYRRVTKQWSSSGPDMVPILTAEFQYNPAGNPWITEGGPGLAPGEKYEVSLLIDKTRPAPDIGDQITTYVHKDGCLRYVAQPLANGFSPSNRNIPYVAAYDWDEVTDVANSSRKVRRLTGSRDLRNLKTVLAYDGVPGVLRSTTTQGEITGEGGVDEATTTYFYNTQKHVIKTILPSPLPGNTGKTQVVYATYPTVPGADTSTGRADDYLYLHRPTKVAKYVVDNPNRTSNEEPAASDKIEETKTTYVEKVDGSLAAYALIGATAKSQFTAGAGQAKEQIDVTYTAKGFPTGKTIQTFSADAPVTESYVYDHRGLMIENTGPAGRVKRLAYDPRGRPILEEDYTNGSAAKPSVWNYSYFNHMGELVWKDGPRYGPEDYQFFDYDGAGRKIVEVVWNSRAKADNSGVEADTYSIVNHYYDGFGNRIKSVDPRGNYSEVTYDVMGRALTSKSFAADGALLSQQSSTYEPGGEVATQVDPLGGVTSMNYTTDGKPTLITKPDGSTEKWTYYLDGRVKTHTLENLSVWDYTYDDLLLKETRVLTLGGTLLAKGITTKDIRGNVVSEESFADAGTSYVTTKEYDGLGRVIRETGPPALAVEGNPVSDQQEKIYRYSFNTTTHADITTITEGAGENARVTVVTTDDLGREASTVVKDSNDQILESVWTVYDKAHHFVRKFKGSDSTVKADQSVYTDTQGRPVLTKFGNEGDWKYQRIVYDTAGNAIRATDEEGKTTSNEFDGLNRIKQKLYPDGAFVRFVYDGAGNLKSREMPGGLTWHAAYTPAGQLDHEYLQQGGAISRYFGYSYYPAAGANAAWVGLLESIDERASGAGAQVRKHDFLYDAYRRPSTKTSVGGADLEVTLSTSYDFLNRVTSATRTSAVAGGGTVETKVESAHDGYGQLYLETVSVNGTVQSQLGQRWDSLGMRTGLAAGAGAPAIGGSPWARDFGFSYYSNGRLKGISTHADQYRTSYAYADNGLVNSASLSDGPHKLKEVLTPLATAYDSRGRSIGRTTYAAGGQVLAETVQRRGDSRVQTYGITRGNGAGGSWANAAESRAYAYDDRGKLTSESYLKNPWAPSADHAQETLSYGFDAAKLGVLISVKKSGDAPVWNATNVDDFARANGQSSDPALRTFEVKGNAHGPGQFGLYIASGHDATNEAAYAKKADVFPASRGSSTPGTPNADWVYPISLAPGEYSLQARARHMDHPARPYEAKSGRINVTVEGGAIGYSLTHDGSGRVTRRTWGGGDFVQDITWSADGHIARVELTDNSAAGNTGYVWEALYDAQGRRIRTSWLPAGTGAAARVTNSWFDPEIEFLEIAVEHAGKRQWKLHGPDLSGGYGGAQGIGGCEAVIDEGTAEISPVINDFFGNTVAHVKTAGTSSTTDDQVVWHEAQMSGYGVLPGFAVAGLEHTGDLLSAMNWQGRRLDPTGFYDMGARAYDPEGRKFLSPDPLGHAASMDLYNYANGDPINHIDPDGRLARMIGGAISSIFEFGRASASAFGEVSEFLGVSDFMGGMSAAARDMSEFVGGSAVDLLMGKSLDGYGPSNEGVAVWNKVMIGVQIAALPLSFVGGPVGVVAMGASSFASFTQGDLAGAAMGGLGAFSAAKAASFAIRAESGAMSAVSNGPVGRGFGSLTTSGSSATKSLEAGSKWGGGWAKSGPVSWQGGRPSYNPANFKWGTQKGLKPMQRAGAEVHELTHIDQFSKQPRKVWHAQSKLPGRSISMYSLERQAYRAQAEFLGEPFKAGMPFQSQNMWDALNTDLLYGAGAVAASGGAIWYFNSNNN